MLTVSVGSNERLYFRKSEKRIIETVLQRRPFAEIYRIANDRDTGNTRNFFKQVGKRRSASIIDDDNRTITSALKVTGKCDQTLARFVGRDHDDAGGHARH